MFIAFDSKPFRAVWRSGTQIEGYSPVEFRSSKLRCVFVRAEAINITLLAE